MNPHQLSLWDNVDMETGFQMLVELRFPEAVTAFTVALEKAGGHDSSIETGLDACAYWGARLERWITRTAKRELQPEEDSPDPQPQAVGLLLKDYQAYSFRQLKNFGNSLLDFLAGRMITAMDIGPGLDEPAKAHRAAPSGLLNFPEKDLDSLSLLIRLLLVNRQLRKKATGILDRVAQRYKPHPSICYLRSEAYYLNGFKTESFRLYTLSLLQFPGHTAALDFLPEPLEKLLQQYGPYMTPAYGAVKNILPLVRPPDDILITDEEHHRALQGYQHYYQAETLLKSQGPKPAVAARKQLLQEQPDFYHVYLDQLRHRETGH